MGKEMTMNSKHCSRSYSLVMKNEGVHIARDLKLNMNSNSYLESHICKRIELMQENESPKGWKQNLGKGVSCQQSSF